MTTLDTDIPWAALREAALAARAHAYAPYSQYLVGAALLDADGHVHRGANVENASYGLCLCAERSAFARAIADGVRSFRAILVMTDGDRPGTPCGMCRQVLAELENDRERIGLRQAELKVADQKRELDRATNLLERQLVTQDQFDDTNSAYELAVTERDLAAIKLEETLVRAPFAGQITERIIVPGQFLQLASPTFGIVDVEPLRVRIHLPDVIARKVRVGDKVNLDVEAAPKPVPAVVERIAPVVDPTTSTVRLTLLVQGEPENLRVGGFVKVRVTTDTQMEALAVPKVALVEEGGLRSVFVADSDSVRKVEVRTGLYDDSHIEILDGVEQGDWIVSLGQGGLRMGSKIEVLNATDVGWVAPEKPATDETQNGEDADTTATDPDETVTLAADGR